MPRDVYRFGRAGCAPQPGGAAMVPFIRAFNKGETVSMAVQMDFLDGSPLDWSDLVFTYRWGCETAPAAGVVADPAAGMLFIRPGPVPVGEHFHTLIVTRVSTGDSVALFDGTLTILRSF